MLIFDFERKKKIQLKMINYWILNSCFSSKFFSGFCGESPHVRFFCTRVVENRIQFQILHCALNWILVEGQEFSCVHLTNSLLFFLWIHLFLLVIFFNHTGEIDFIVFTLCFLWEHCFPMLNHWFSLNHREITGIGVALVKYMFYHCTLCFPCFSRSGNLIYPCDSIVTIVKTLCYQVCLK